MTEFDHCHGGLDFQIRYITDGPDIDRWQLWHCDDDITQIVEDRRLPMGMPVWIDRAIWANEEKLRLAAHEDAIADEVSARWVGQQEQKYGR